MSGAGDHDDFAFEPIPGLPAHLPEGEHILWQGSPRWRGLLRHALHIGLIALYCGILMAWVVISGVADGQPLASALQSIVMPMVAVAVLFAILTGLGYGLARSTIYTITNRRVVMRFGLVLPITINLPFKRIETAALKRYADGTGDIPLTLKGKDRIAWLHLWPHTRPWRFSKPQPMLRDLPEADSVASLLAEAMANELPEGRAMPPQGTEPKVDAAGRAGMAAA